MQQIWPVATICLSLTVSAIIYMDTQKKLAVTEEKFASYLQAFEKENNRLNRVILEIKEEVNKLIEIANDPKVLVGLKKILLMK